jgi:hypothetical protein
MVLGIRSYESEIGVAGHTCVPAAADNTVADYESEILQPNSERAVIGSSPSDPVGCPPGSMHSIVYTVIFTRKGLERFDCSKVTADFVASTGSKGQDLLAGNGASSFSCIRRGRKLFWSAAVSTNPNCCDTSVILSQLETSRPRGSERVAFIAFGNLRSFTR